MIRSLTAAAIGLAIVGGATAAAAQTYDYTFSGTFSTVSGSVTGQFRYDAATNTFSNVSISTTAGDGLFDPAPARTYDTVVTVGPIPSSADELIATEGPVGFGQYGILLDLSPGLDEASPVLVNALEFTCFSADCDGKGFNRQTLSVTSFTRTLVPPAPVPTLSEWALILFGTILAGGTALYVQRRRPAL